MGNQTLTSGDTWTMLRASTAMYLIMSVVGLSIMHFGYDQLGHSLPINMTTAEWQVILIRGFTCGGALLCLSWYFEHTFESFQQLKELVQNLLGQAPIPAALYLAAISAIGEEVLFRGGLQPALGLGLTSALFGLMHLGPNGRLSSWSVWAFAAGLLIGWVYQQSGELWSAIIAHFLINGTSMIRIRREFLRNQRQTSEQLANRKENS